MLRESGADRQTRGKELLLAAALVDASTELVIVAAAMAGSLIYPIIARGLLASRVPTP